MRLKSRTLAALGASVFGLSLMPVMAAAESGWRVNASVSENISATENGVISATRFGVSALTETERMRFGINTGFGVRVGTDTSTATLPNLGLTFGLDTSKRSSITASANLDFQPITFLEEDVIDLTTSEESGIRRSVGGSLSARYELTPRTVVSLTGSVRDLSYSETSAALVPTRTNSLGATLNFEAADDLGVVASLGARWIDSENATNTSSFTLDSSVRVTFEATSRLSLNGGVGVTWAETDEDILGLRTTTRSTSMLVNGGLSYGTPYGTLRLNLSQRVAPAAGTGDLTRFSTATLGYNHAVNRTTTLGLNLSVSDQESLATDTSTTQYAISPNVAWELGEDLQARLGYSLRRRDGDTSHRVNFTISKTFSSAL